LSTPICIKFRYDMIDNLQRLLSFVFFLITLYNVKHNNKLTKCMRGALILISIKQILPVGTFFFNIKSILESIMCK
jgi:uncharacterized protein with ParB-like and HNH nuclease domain